MALLIITTGGTIDKTYASEAGTRDLANRDTQVHSILAQARADTYDIMALLAKDSLDMTADDRAVIAKACASANTERIVVVHGTDTMSLTAKALASSVEIKGKTIVLTGSAQPWCLKNSDADFNLGLAIGAASCATQGVYIAMSGQVFHHDQCRKNQATGLFEPIAAR